jgi:hypothetical protein
MTFEEQATDLSAECARLRSINAELLAALKGVLAVADRKTDEFDAARAAIARAEGCQRASPGLWKE